jgi:membrane protein insertase Oxa1/YidC/SpoIIIJ
MYPYLKEFDVEILINHLASIAIVVIFVGSIIILLYQRHRDKQQVTNQIKNENENLRDKLNKMMELKRASYKTHDIDPGIVSRIKEK